MYMMMRVTQFSIIHLFSTEISADEWSVRKIENRIYILEKKSCRCSNCYSISCLLLAN